MFIQLYNFLFLQSILTINYPYIDNINNKKLTNCMYLWFCIKSYIFKK